MTEERERAAPPDTAGHRGSGTRPPEVVEPRERNAPGEESEAIEPAPPLHRDAPGGRDVGRSSLTPSGLMWILVVVVLVFGVTYCWTAGRG